MIKKLHIMDLRVVDPHEQVDRLVDALQLFGISLARATQPVHIDRRALAVVRIRKETWEEEVRVLWSTPIGLSQGDAGFICDGYYEIASAGGSVNGYPSDEDRKPVRDAKHELEKLRLEARAHSAEIEDPFDFRSVTAHA